MLELLGMRAVEGEDSSCILQRNVESEKYNVVSFFFPQQEKHVIEVLDRFACSVLHVRQRWPECRHAGFPTWRRG